MSKNSMKNTIECLKKWRTSVKIVLKPKKHEDENEYQSLSIFHKLANKNKNK